MNVVARLSVDDNANPFKRSNTGNFNNEKAVYYYRNSSVLQVPNDGNSVERSPSIASRFSSPMCEGAENIPLLLGLKLVMINTDFVQMCMALTVLYFVITGI